MITIALSLLLSIMTIYLLTDLFRSEPINSSLKNCVKSLGMAFVTIFVVSMVTVSVALITTLFYLTMISETNCSGKNPLREKTYTVPQTSKKYGLKDFPRSDQ